MSIAIFYFLLLMFQIIMLVKTIKKTNKKNWWILLSTIVFSIILVGIFFVYTWINGSYIGGWNFLGYLIINIMAVSVYIFALCSLRH